MSSLWIKRELEKRSLAVSFTGTTSPHVLATISIEESSVVTRRGDPTTSLFRLTVEHWDKANNYYESTEHRSQEYKRQEERSLCLFSHVRLLGLLSSFLDQGHNEPIAFGELQEAG